MENVAIFGVPRSGTTWLGQIMNSSPNVAYRYQPLFSYEFKDKLTLSSTHDEIQDFYTSLLWAKSEFVLTNNIFPKNDITHLVWKEVRYHHLASLLLQKSDLKLLYVSRDPVEVINSWYNAPKEFHPDWDIRQEWFYGNLKNQGRAEEFYGMQGWLKAQSIYTEIKSIFPDRVMIVKYSNLRSNTEGVIKKIFSWLNLTITSSTIDFIRDTSKRISSDIYSVNKRPAVINLPEDIIEQIIKLKSLKNENR